MRGHNRLISVRWWAFALFGLCLAAFGQAQPENVDLARWAGGNLSREHFIRDYDPDEEMLKKGGEGLAKAVCKASLQEVYGAEARKAGLERDPTFLEELEKWQRRRLARVYGERNGPRSDFSREELLAAYTARREERYTTSGAADLHILFVRCDPETKAICGRRMETMQERFRAGEELQILIAEERSRSGEANGFFEEVPLTRLSSDLRGAVLATSGAEFTPTISTPQGLFWLRVSVLERPKPIPFEQVKNRLERELRRERMTEWRQREVESLGEEITGASAMEEEALFAVAARRQHLHLEASFLEAERRRRRWLLADAAFFRDGKILPTDEEILKSLEEESVRRTYEIRHLLVGVVSAAETRDQLYPVAEGVLDKLKNSPNPGETLKRLAAANEAIETYTFKKLMLHQWRGVHPALGSAEFELPVGGWSGPLAFREPFSVEGESLGQADHQEVPSGLAFVVVLESATLPLEELRKKFNRQARDQITTIPSFVETMGKRWRFQLLVDYEP